VNGNAIGGAVGAGVMNSAAGTLIINGNATGGAGAVAHGVQNTSTGQTTINGTAIGSATATTPGVANTGTMPVILKNIRYGTLGCSPVSGLVVFKTRTPTLIEVINPARVAAGLYFEILG